MKKVITLVLVICMLLSMCACGTKPAKAPSAPAETKENTSSEESVLETFGSGVEGNVAEEQKPLRFRLKTEPNTLDPHKTSGTGDPQVIQYQMYESLFREEKDGTIVPALAESYELAEDSTSITLNLRKDVFFHNDLPMTADDVVFSLNRAMETGYNSAYVGAIDKVEKINDYTVKLSLKYSYAPIITCLSTLSTAIVCKSYVEENGDDILTRNPMGTGPYMLKQWVSGDKLVYEAYPKYWRGEAKIKEASIVFISDNTAAAISLETGDIDVMTNLSTADIPTIQDNPELQFVTGPAASQVLVSFNNASGKFADPRLREAVYLCIDRQEIVDVAADGYGEVQTAALDSVLPECPKNLPVPEKNVERAKELVAEAGYPDGLTVSMPTIDNGTYSKPATLLKEQLAPCGINIEIELMERAAWDDMVIYNTNYEIAIWALPITALDSDFCASKFYSENCGGAGNFSNCNNEEIDKLILQGRLLPLGEERTANYLKFCEAIRDNFVVCPIYTNMRSNAASVHLGGVYPSATLHMYMYDYYWMD